MTLFWKIFVSFGIAMTVTLVGAVFVSFRVAEQAFDQAIAEDRGQMIREASEALADDGRTGLVEWLRDNDRLSSPTMMLVIDEAGEELLDRPVAGRFVRMVLDTSREPRGAPSNFRPRRFWDQLIGPDGQTYSLFFIRRPPTLLGVLNWPSTQVAVLAIAVAAAAVTSLVLARYLSAPIVLLQRASRALAAGNLDTRVGHPSDRRRDEVGTLARDFDAMAERIQALITAQETLLRDISHELRSPLARIRVALALAERHTEESARTDFDRIEQETERLDQLVGQVMLLTRLRTQHEVRQDPVRLDELVREIVENASFERPQVRIDSGLEPVAEVHGDENELRSAIENVIRNAFAYSGRDGAVEVELSGRAYDVTIRVADSGPGVRAEDLDRIFEPFYRTDESRNHQITGEGIGLAITARVIERHGGTVRARNRPEGGLEITLTIPYEPPTERGLT